MWFWADCIFPGLCSLCLLKELRLLVRLLSSSRRWALWTHLTLELSLPIGPAYVVNVQMGPTSLYQPTRPHLPKTAPWSSHQSGNHSQWDQSNPACTPVWTWQPGSSGPWSAASASVGEAERDPDCCLLAHMKSPRPEQSVTPLTYTLTLTCIAVTAHTFTCSESQAHSQKLIQQNHGASTVRQVLGDTKVKKIRTHSRETDT